MMRPLIFTPFFWAIILLCSCTAEKPAENIQERYPNGDKKLSIWVYPDGSIKKGNTWYINGIKETEVEYRNGVPHGHFRLWTHLGRVILEGEYENGKRTGTWTSYYPDRKKQGDRYYRDDHEVGDWVGVYPNGNTAYEQHFSEQGDSIGIWKKWYENGSLEEENSCFGTVENGTLVKYRNDGTRESEFQCKNGVIAGNQTHYYSDGKKIQWKDEFHVDSIGLLDTNTIFRTFYYGDGQVQKEEQWNHNVSKGTREYLRKGVWKWYDSQGNLIKESLVHYDTLGMHNIIEDRRTDYGICGNAVNDTLVQFTVCAETTFIEYAGWKLHGTLWHYRQGHQLRYEEDWENGSLKESRSYYIDSLDGNPKGGILASQGYSLNGKRNGIWRNWYRNGVLKDSLLYEDGEMTGEQFSYDSTGTLTIHKTAAGKNKPVIVHILGAN